jgi:nucleotide-binding universal stress UspA family protein
MAIKTKKILVPLDGSKNSIRGLDMAIHLARQSQGTVTALSVKTVPGIYLGF